MKITVVGTGYVGLVTGTCLAETGNDVLCIDIDEDKVKIMQEGKVPIYEPHLDLLFERNIRAGRLNFSTSLDEGLEHGTIIMLALPTPEDEDGSADLSYILGAAKDIGQRISEYKVIVDKSTVPVGTADMVRDVITKETDADFEATMELVRQVRYGYAYSFKYSARPGTPAAERATVDPAVADDRLQGTIEYLGLFQDVQR